MRLAAVSGLIPVNQPGSPQQGWQGGGRVACAPQLTLPQDPGLSPSSPLLQLCPGVLYMVQSLAESFKADVAHYLFVGFDVFVSVPQKKNTLQQPGSLKRCDHFALLTLLNPLRWGYVKVRVNIWYCMVLSQQVPKNSNMRDGRGAYPVRLCGTCVTLNGNAAVNVISTFLLK